MYTFRGWHGALRRRLVLAAALLILLMGCSREPATPEPSGAVETATLPLATAVTTATPTPVPAATAERTAATLVEADCPFDPGNHSVTCGYLTVRENRDQTGEQHIKLFVAVVHSRSEQPLPDPVVFLHGGPGGSAVLATTSIARDVHGLLADRDLVVFDQRGAGFSEPSLDCPEFHEQVYPHLAELLTPDEMGAVAEEALLACYRRLTGDGIDLTAYHSAASAADVNDLRLALGYDQVNLFGVSYGTRLALTMMRDFPHAVRSAVLDSSVPLEADLHAEHAAGRQRAFDLLFSRCAASPACNDAFPDLGNRFYALVDSLDEEPLSVRLRSPAEAESFTVMVTGNQLISALFFAMYDSWSIPHLPKRLAELERGNISNWRNHLTFAIFLQDWISTGARAAIMCNEEFAFSSGEPYTTTAHPREEEYVAWSIAVFSDDCALWQLPGGPAIENEPVRSDIPTLVLAGEYDPITPPHWGQQVAGTLDNAYYYEFQGVAHGVVGARRCARDVMTAFVTAPEQPPDLDCYAQQQDLGFITR